MSSPFISRDPVLEDYWRGIILFGRNVASYKFALARTLLELRPQSGELLKIDDLAPLFSKHIATHLQSADKQGTSASSKFLDGCRDFNAGNITEDKLHDFTVQHGFNNVIDAFHIVASGEIQQRFYIDERKTNNGIRITEEFSELLNGSQAISLPFEVEARWRLVETAWELGVSRSLVSVDHDLETETLFALDRTRRRSAVTGSREALNGYQKGKCFYCFTEIQLGPDGLTTPDVDHFFPHSLKQAGFGNIIDGVWNLVLACKKCNRGVGGKFDRIPVIQLVERLQRRNEFLISSHHPLKETLIRQSGNTEEKRTRFLNDFFNRSRSALLHTWEPVQRGKSAF